MAGVAHAAFKGKNRVLQRRVPQFESLEQRTTVVRGEMGLNELVAKIRRRESIEYATFPIPS